MVPVSSRGLRGSSSDPLATLSGAGGACTGTGTSCWCRLNYFPDFSFWGRERPASSQRNSTPFLSFPIQSTRNRTTLLNSRTSDSTKIDAVGDGRDMLQGPSSGMRLVITRPDQMLPTTTRQASWQTHLFSLEPCYWSFSRCELGSKKKRSRARGPPIQASSTQERG